MQSVLSKHPDSADLVLELGKDYLVADRVGLAAATLQRARTLAPQNWEILSVLAVALDTDGRSDEARQVLVQADKMSPENPVILNNLALNDAASGHLDGAIEMMRHAADLPSASVQTRENLALLLALRGDTDRAERMTAHDLPTEMAAENVQIYRQWAANRR
jgi:Flp pilus assembly protein TadD